MSWLRLSVALPPRGLEHLLVGALYRAGARSVGVDGGRVIALLREAAGAEGHLRASLPGFDPDPRWEIVTEDPPREFDQRRSFPDPPVSDILPVDPTIALHPGSAFGDGTHPTTRGCIELMRNRVREGGRIADVGAGSGILSIFAARLGAERVLAVDADAVACVEARRNVRENGVEDRVDVVRHELRPGSLGPISDERWSGIVANIELPILGPLLPGLVEILTPDGWLLVSGFLPAERAEMDRAARVLGVEIAEVVRHDGWWTVAIVRGDGIPGG